MNRRRIAAEGPLYSVSEIELMFKKPQTSETPLWVNQFVVHWTESRPVILFSRITGKSIQVPWPASAFRWFYDLVGHFRVLTHEPAIWRDFLQSESHCLLCFRGPQTNEWQLTSLDGSKQSEWVKCEESNCQQPQTMRAQDCRIWFQERIAKEGSHRVSQSNPGLDSDPVSLIDPVSCVVCHSQFMSAMDSEPNECPAGYECAVSLEKNHLNPDQWILQGGWGSAVADLHWFRLIDEALVLGCMRPSKDVVCDYCLLNWWEAGIIEEIPQAIHPVIQRMNQMELEEASQCFVKDQHLET